MDGTPESIPEASDCFQAIIRYMVALLLFQKQLQL